MLGYRMMSADKNSKSEFRYWCLPQSSPSANQGPFWACLKSLILSSPNSLTFEMCIYCRGHTFPRNGVPVDQHLGFQPRLTAPRSIKRGQRSLIKSVWEEMRDRKGKEWKEPEKSPCWWWKECEGSTKPPASIVETYYWRWDGDIVDGSSCINGVGARWRRWHWPQEGSGTCSASVLNERQELQEPRETDCFRCRSG